MIRPICERGKGCVFLVKKKENYSYPIYARSQFMASGEQLNYYCSHPKVLKKHIVPLLLNHEKKFSSCKLKTTDTLERFQKC